MRVDELLTEIEPLPFRARCERLAGLRRLSGDPALAALLDGLAGRGHYERSLALFTASAVRDEASLAHIAAATRDPDAELACEAIRLGVRFGVGPGPFLDRLGDAPAAVRSALYEAVRKWRRSDLADALVDAVAGRWGDEEAAALLSACSPGVAAARLDALAHAVPNWKAIGHAHPGLMLDHAERRLAELPEGVAGGWWSRHALGVAAALHHGPGRVVALLERHCRTGPLPYALQPGAGALIGAEPERMLRLLLSDGHRGHLRDLLHRRSVRDRLARLGGTGPADLARAVRDDEGALCLLLKAFAPGRRAAVFDAAMSGTDLGAREFGEALLGVLPRAVRVREARRMLGLRKVAESPARVWAVTSFLPYDEALPVLGEVTRRPDAGERGTGYALLIACAGRSGDPATLTRMLESLGRLRNEQDPVRLPALNALHSVPEGLLRPEHAAAVAQLAEDALNARDCSYTTRHTLGQIAGAFARQGAIRDDADLLSFALDLIDRLIGHAGALRLGRLDRALRRGQEHRLAAMLAPHLDAGARRDDHRLALLVVQALGRRAHRVPRLQDALEAALDARDDGVLGQAIALWLDPPATRAERVGRVVAKDPSAVAVHRVFAVIARERTDLLDLVLTENTPAGRFRRPDVTYVPRARRVWMRRWTARQRGAYLALLERVAASGTLPEQARGDAVALMARVPGVDPARIRAHLDGEPYLRRAALTALAWTPSPQDVLPELLSRAGSDDAHVAVYAASRAARFVPPSALSAVLGPILADGKITARKEALRILLRSRVPDALDLVAAAWDDPGQHRDVRAAIVSAVRPRLDEPVALRILEEAAAGPRDLARQVIGTPPLLVDERFRAAYAALVLRVARSEDPEARDAALPGVPAWAPWAPDAPAVLADIVTDLGGTRGWRGALHALVGCVANGIGAAELGTAAAELAAAPDLPDAEAERDLPAHQRLAALVDAVRVAAEQDRDGAEHAIRAVDGHLPEPLACALTASTLRWDTPAIAATVDALADRCAGGGALAVLHVAEALIGGPLGEDDEDGFYYVRPDPSVPEDVRPHAARLAARGDLAGGLFACALTGRHGPRAGWPGTWRALLRALRTHPVPDVAFAARSVRTAAE
ncbi:hypothetical protein [Actinomadura rubrisoli]|uniref:HEAT repeat domain-containing protein n=1 Tax=Actinomadura rubrisoli TaxID=2530368 RepID=A0A4R5AGQ9_9ACTN|nr:hypothetical protein [Actinomadura rubrisoli]TDD71813.1 hypothetical protein E1298_35470 [Actinomadura rubrisoli]